MPKPERARERYQLDIRLVDEEAFEVQRPSLVDLALHVSGVGRIVLMLRAFEVDHIPSKEPWARIITITERSTGKTVRTIEIEAGHAGQEIAKAIHFEYMRHDADDWAEQWVHTNTQVP